MIKRNIIYHMDTYDIEVQCPGVEYMFSIIYPYRMQTILGGAYGYVSKCIHYASVYSIYCTCGSKTTGKIYGSMI